MKIIIKSPNAKPIRLLFPTRLVFNRFTAFLGTNAINKYISLDEAKINSRDLHRLIKEINRFKRKCPDLLLVDIESCDGNIVHIKL